MKKIIVFSLCIFTLIAVSAQEDDLARTLDGIQDPVFQPLSNLFLFPIGLSVVENQQIHFGSALDFTRDYSADELYETGSPGIYSDTIKSSSTDNQVFIIKRKKAQIVVGTLLEFSTDGSSEFVNDDGYSVPGDIYTAQIQDTASQLLLNRFRSKELKNSNMVRGSFLGASFLYNPGRDSFIRYNMTGVPVVYDSYTAFTSTGNPYVNDRIKLALDYAFSLGRINNRDDWAATLFLHGEADYNSGGYVAIDPSGGTVYTDLVSLEEFGGLSVLKGGAGFSNIGASSDTGNANAGLGASYTHHFDSGVELRTQLRYDALEYIVDSTRESVSENNNITNEDEFISYLTNGSVYLSLDVPLFEGKGTLDVGTGLDSRYFLYRNKVTDGSECTIYSDGNAGHYPELSTSFIAPGDLKAASTYPSEMYTVSIPFDLQLRLEMPGNIQMISRIGGGLFFEHDVYKGFVLSDSSIFSEAYNQLGFFLGTPVETGFEIPLGGGRYLSFSGQTALDLSLNSLQQGALADSEGAPGIAGDLTSRSDRAFSLNIAYSVRR